MNILVTGSNGQLGNELRLLEESFPQFNFLFTDVEELDISNQKIVQHYLKTNKINAVINCAAYTAVDKAESEKELAWNINVKAVKKLAESCKDNNCFLVHISTDYVFDGNHFQPYNESDFTNPQSHYGDSKLHGENAVFEFAGQGMILRTSWLYSSFGHNFLKTILKFGLERDELKVVFDQIGTPTFARDLAKTILDILPKAIEKGKVRTYHYSNEGVCSWYDFAKEIVELENLACHIKPILSKDYPLPAQRPFYSVLDKTKIKDTFNIEIPYWKDSVKDCIERIKFDG